VVQGEGRNSLKEEETERETDTVLDWGGYPSKADGSMRTLGKLNDGLTECKVLWNKEREPRFTLTSRGLVIWATSETRRKTPALQKKKKTLSLTAVARLAFFLPVFSLHSLSRSCR